MKYNPGDHVIVTINNQLYDTVIEENGVQRFVGNKIVEKYVLENIVRADRQRMAGKPMDLYDLNELELDFRNNLFTLDEMIQFSALHRYSVAGLCDLDFMENVEIYNPLWEDDDDE